MAFFRARKKARYAAWGVTLAVLLAIFVVRNLPQPWRGLIDAGVVAGLGVGVMSLLLGTIQRVAGGIPQADPELPELPA